MAFTLEDGTGVPGANALVDEAFVTAYLTDRNRETENLWSTQVVGIQQSAIIAASDYIEQRWRTRFLGRRTHELQGLSWPRSGIIDRDGFTVDQDSVPLKVEQATAEYAVRALGASLLPDPVVDDSGRTVVEKREKVGPIEEETHFSEGSMLSQLIRPYPAADRLLAEFVSARGVIRG